MNRDESADCVKIRRALQDTTLPTGGGPDGSQPVGKEPGQAILLDTGFEC